MGWGNADNRGPLKPVAGVGEEAFNPGDVGRFEIAVRAGEVIFAVAVVSGSSDTEIPDKIEQLAKRIAQDL